MTGARARAQQSARWLWPGLFLGVFACARQEAPRGGEPDRFPPAVVSVVPEALSTTDDLDEEIQIQFNERISERPVAGTLLDAVVVSPTSPEIRVRHKGDMLEVQVTEGFVPGLVYRVTVLPVIRDLFGNTMRRPFEFVFSTGGAFNPNAVVGQVLDRVTGRAARDALVLAALTGDTTEAPVVHVARADSGGLYVLRYLNPGTYDLVGFLDRNRTRDVDPFETQGGVRIELGAADTVLDASSFTIMDPDTTPADLTRAEVAERTLLRLTFDDYLDPDAPLATVGATVQRADGQGPAAEVRLLQHEHNFVAVRRETARALADSIARADSVARAAARARAAAGDTLAADTTAAPPGPRPQPPPPVNFVGRAQNTDSTSLGVLGLTLPSRVIYAELADSLETAVDYVLRIQGVVNLAGLRSGVDSIRVTRAPPANAPRPPDR